MPGQFGSRVGSGLVHCLRAARQERDSSNVGLDRGRRQKGAWGLDRVVIF
jgi:hypothetical protein